MSINTHWFQNRLADRRLSQRGLAKKLGLDPAAVSLMFRGKRRMQMHEAADVAHLLGVTMNEVLEHAGIRAPTNGHPTAPQHLDLLERSVPLVYWMDGEGELHTIEPGERVDITASLDEDVVACQCRTAMSPLQHMDRWLLFFAAPSKAGVLPEAA